MNWPRIPLSKRLLCCLKDERGMSFFELFALVGASALVTAAILRHMNSLQKSALSIERRQNATNLHSKLQRLTDCEQTLGVVGVVNPNLKCSDFSSVTLRKKDGSVIGQNLGSSWFRLDEEWKFQATCTTDHISINAESLKPDPVTRKIVSLTGQLTKEGRLCSRYFYNDPCPDDELEMGRTQNTAACVFKETLVDFSTSFTEAASANSIAEDTQNLNGYGYCALVNVEFSHQHNHPHNHTSTSSPNRSIGVDCQIYQFSKGVFQIMASPRAIAESSPSVLCQYQCWKYYE